MIILAIVGWVVLLGGGGAFLTKLSPWYYELAKPSWKPPDWLFGPVWTTIFMLAGLAWWRAWGETTAFPAQRGLVVAAYVVNGGLNLLWSYCFFWRRRPDWALREVGALLVSIVALIIVVGRLDSVAALLLAPYLLWVLFASRLNQAIVQLNGPFDQPGPR